MIVRGVLPHGRLATPRRRLADVLGDGDKAESNAGFSPARHEDRAETGRKTDAPVFPDDREGRLGFRVDGNILRPDGFLLAGQAHQALVDQRQAFAGSAVHRVEAVVDGQLAPVVDAVERHDDLERVLDRILPTVHLEFEAVLLLPDERPVETDLEQHQGLVFEIPFPCVSGRADLAGDDLVKGHLHVPLDATSGHHRGEPHAVVVVDPLTHALRILPDEFDEPGPKFLAHAEGHEGLRLTTHGFGFPKRIASPVVLNERVAVVLAPVPGSRLSGETLVGHEHDG